ncbi:MAG: hypothetical protein V3T83_00945 [Acidobacteriota bacterium]
MSELNRKAKFYSLTGQGKEQLAVETEQWAAFSQAISKVLRPGFRQGKESGIRSQEEGDGKA